MSINNLNRQDRDKAAYRDNPNDGGVDRRVSDLDGTNKLTDIETYLTDQLTYEPAVALETATSLATAFNTSSVDVTSLQCGVLKAKWTGAQDSNDATFVVEVSDDDTDWVQIGESGMVLLSEDDTQIWQILEFPAQYLRLAYTQNSNTTGTVDITFVGKK